MHSARGVVRVLVVVHGELDKEHIDGPLVEHVAGQPKRAGRGAGRGDPGVVKVNSVCGKPLAQEFAHHRPIAVHLGDRAAHESHVTAFFPLELHRAPIQRTAPQHVRSVTLCRRHLAPPTANGSQATTTNMHSDSRQSSATTSKTCNTPYFCASFGPQGQDFGFQMMHRMDVAHRAAAGAHQDRMRLRPDGPSA